MQYLIRFVQMHETFRVPEIASLAKLENVQMKIIHYHKSTPFCIIELENDHVARTIGKRSILAQAIYELWATGEDFPSIHANLKQQIRTNSIANLATYGQQSFRFDVDCFQGKHSPAEQLALIESFNFLPLHGPIKMRDPELSMCVFEEYATNRAPSPRKIYLARSITSTTGRSAIDKYNLKKRRYISRTSMDAELSLVTANMVLAAPGKIIYDPFVGTGSFSVACAHFGAVALGSDIDPRSMRGTKTANLYSNFEQYGTTGNFFDSFVSDLTHTPLRAGRIFDGIVCDPPYGVREGPKTLGNRRKDITEPVLVEGELAHL